MKSTPNAFEADLAKGAPILAALLRGINEGMAEAGKSAAKFSAAMNQIGKKFDGDWKKIQEDAWKDLDWDHIIDDKPLRMVKE